MYSVYKFLLINQFNSTYFKQKSYDLFKTPTRLYTEKPVVTKQPARVTLCSADAAEVRSSSTGVSFFLFVGGVKAFAERGFLQLRSQPTVRLCASLVPCRSPYKLYDQNNIPQPPPSRCCRLSSW